MARQPFEIEWRNLKELDKFFMQSPRKAARASGMVLNTMAFKARVFIGAHMSDYMTVRNASFIDKSMRFTKNKEWRDISRQFSTVGSIALGNTSGWTEQAHGASTKRNKTFQQTARGRSRKGVVRRKWRADKPPLKASSIGGRGASSKNQLHREIAFVAWIKRENIKEHFVLFRKHKPGLFYLRRKKVVRLSSFKRVQPKKVDWIGKSTDKFLRWFDLQKAWADALDRTLIKPARKLKK